MTGPGPALARMESIARALGMFIITFQPLVPHLPSSSSAFNLERVYKDTHGSDSMRRMTMRFDLDP
jgi:hypothetical protein